MADEGIAVGLDLGTTKICAIVAELTEPGCLNILGVGSCPSDGLRRGVVIDVEKSVNSIKKAVYQAELMAGVEVAAVYAGIAGEHISSFDSRGVVAVDGDNGAVSAADRERVIAAARAVSIPAEREILHVLPQEFIVDGQSGIREPVGMVGVRLEANVHIVTGAITSAQNICKSILRAGIEVRDIVLEPLASSCAVLDGEEKDMGVCLVDIGGGTTDVALFSEGGVRHTSVIGLGGQNVTNDVAIGLRTSWPHAENIKCTYGAALVDSVGEDETVNLPAIAASGPRSVLRRELSAIIQPRMEEIFTMVRGQLERTDWNSIPRISVVLTGGGALLEGVVGLAERVFELPVRLGIPEGHGGMSEKVMSPIYATAVGLVSFGLENQKSTNSSVHHPHKGLSEGRFDTVLSRMKEWFQMSI